MNFPFRFPHWKAERDSRKRKIDYQFTFSDYRKSTLGIYYSYFGIWYLVDCCWYNRSHALSKTWKPQCYMEGNISELFKSFWGLSKYLSWFLWFNLVELCEFLCVLNAFGGLRKTNCFQRIMSIPHSASRIPHSKMWIAGCENTQQKSQNQSPFAGWKIDKL